MQTCAAWSLICLCSLAAMRSLSESSVFSAVVFTLVMDVESSESRALERKGGREGGRERKRESARARARERGELVRPKSVFVLDYKTTSKASSRLLVKLVKQDSICARLLAMQPESFALSVLRRAFMDDCISVATAVSRCSSPL